MEGSGEELMYSRPLLWERLLLDWDGHFCTASRQDMESRGSDECWRFFDRRLRLTWCSWE